MGAALWIMGVLHVATRAWSPGGADQRRWVEGVGWLLGAGVLGVAYSLASVATGAAALAAAAGGLMLVSHRFDEATAGRAIPTSISAMGLAMALGASVMYGAAMPGSALTTAAMPTVLQAGVTAAGLGLLGMSVLLVSEERALRHVSWQALGFVMAALVVACLLGSSSAELGHGLYLPVENGLGERVSVEATFLPSAEAVRAEGVVMPLVAGELAGRQGLQLLVLAVLLVLAGGLGAWHARAGRAAWGVAGAVGVYVGVELVGRVGPKPAPDEAVLSAYGEALKVPVEQLVRAPHVAAGELEVSLAGVLPVLLVVVMVVVVCVFRALSRGEDGERGSRVERDRLRPGVVLAASRDAAMTGAILLAVGVVLGMFVTHAWTGRYVVDHRMAGPLAVVVLAAATVTGWHAASRRGSQRAFAVWTVLPAATLVLASWVFVSGRLTGVPFHVLSVMP